MRAAKVVIAIWMLCALVLWIRDGSGFCVLDALPFVERPESFSRDYEWLALAMVGIGLLGYLMMNQRTYRQRPQDPFRFRLGLFLVPATVIALALLMRRVTLAVRFKDVVGESDKLLEHQYLAVLGLLVLAIVLVIKWYRTR